MKTINITLAGLMVSGAFAYAEDDGTDLNQLHDRLTLSARFGFNIHARFSDRLTPDGLPYNYLDGYVLNGFNYDSQTGHGYDPTSTFAGITGNWGYDNSARQRDATLPINTYPTVAMTRFDSGLDPMASKMNDDSIPGGLELSYMRRLGTNDGWQYGVEAAVNFQKIDIAQGLSVSGTGTQDYYQYFQGGNYLPNSPYRGTFSPNTGGSAYYPYISDSAAPGGSSPVAIALNGNRELEADVWGFRLGPYLERKINRRWAVNLVGGVAVAVVDAHASWRQTLQVGSITDPTISGGSHESDILWGYYLGANAVYHFSHHWSATGGVQFQDVGSYSQNVGDRKVELDFSKAIYIQLGLTYRY